MTVLLIFLGVAGTVFFLSRAVQMRTSYRSMSRVEARRVELEAAAERERRPSVQQRARRWVLSMGYDGDIFPFAAAMAFLYLAVTVGLTALSVPHTLAYLAGLPASFAAVAFTAKLITAQRRKRFNTQLVDLLELVAGQIEGGTGAQRALAVVVPTMSDPIRSEMLAVLDAQLSTKDLVVSMTELAERYPSRAFSMFISALEIDKADGHAIGPAIRQAANLLNTDFQLRAEALAEASQQRSEFFFILAGLGALTGYLLLSADEAHMEAYLSPVGLIGLTVGAVNVLWGVVRVTKLFRRIQGGEPL